MKIISLILLLLLSFGLMSSAAIAQESEKKAAGEENSDRTAESLKSKSSRSDQKDQKRDKTGKSTDPTETKTKSEGDSLNPPSAKSWNHAEQDKGKSDRSAGASETKMNLAGDSSNPPSAKSWNRRDKNKAEQDGPVNSPKPIKEKSPSLQPASSESRLRSNSWANADNPGDSGGAIARTEGKKEITSAQSTFPAGGRFTPASTELARPDSAGLRNQNREMSLSFESDGPHRAGASRDREQFAESGDHPANQDPPNSPPAGGEKDRIYSPTDPWLYPNQPGNQRQVVPNLKIEHFDSRVRQQNQRPERDSKWEVPRIIKRPDGEKVRVGYFDREKNPAVGGSFRGIHQRFGAPQYNYCYLPRSVNTYNIAFRKGYREGFRDGLHYRPSGYGYGRPLCSNFYFGYYFDDPYYFDFWHTDYYPSVYHYYGWVPRWCRPPGIAVYQGDPYPYSWRRPVYYYYQSPQASLDWRGAQNALVSLARAWQTSDIDYFADYLQAGENISIYFDNEYSYSLPAEDFYTMTLDAMSTVRTLSLQFDDPIWLNPNEFFVTGRQIFISPDNARQTVYISYRLHRYGGAWGIIAAGTSPRPIEHDYQDFRNQ